MAISNISSEATGPIVIEFYIETSGAEGTNGKRSHDKHGSYASRQYLSNTKIVQIVTFG